MAVRLPLVLGPSGIPQQLQSGDSLPGSGASDLTVTFSAPSRGRFFDVALSGATVGQKVLCAPSLVMPSGVAEDELEMDPLVCHGAVKTAGQVRLFVGSANGGTLGGARNISVTLI